MWTYISVFISSPCHPFQESWHLLSWKIPDTRSIWATWLTCKHSMVLTNGCWWCDRVRYFWLNDQNPQPVGFPVPAPLLTVYTNAQWVASLSLSKILERDQANKEINKQRNKQTDMACLLFNDKVHERKIYTRKKTKHFCLSYKLLYTFTNYKLEQRQFLQQHGYIHLALTLIEQITKCFLLYRKITSRAVSNIVLSEANKGSRHLVQRHLQTSGTVFIVNNYIYTQVRNYSKKDTIMITVTLWGLQTKIIKTLGAKKKTTV